MDSQPNFCVIMIPKDTNYVLTYEKTKNLEVHFWNKSEVNEQIQHCGLQAFLGTKIFLETYTLC